MIITFLYYLKVLLEHIISTYYSRIFAIEESKVINLPHGIRILRNGSDGQMSVISFNHRIWIIQTFFYVNNY